MLTRRFISLCKLFNSTNAKTGNGSRKIHKRFIATTTSCSTDRKLDEHPLKRTLRILKNDLKDFKDTITGEKFKDDYVPTTIFPRFCDICIIGGGAIGSSIAYWLQEKTGSNINVVVVEKDLSFSKCSTTLSVGGIRQQFSVPENIQMSLYGAEFLRKIKQRFGPESEVNFTPNGYLMLASEFGAQQLHDNSKLQAELGAHNTLLSKEALKKKFPWLDVSDVELGCLGLENEGWFDPWSLLCLLRKAAIDKRTNYLNAEVVDFTFQNRQDVFVEGVDFGTYEALDELIVKLPNGDLKPIKFGLCVIAAGPDSGKVGKLAKIGERKGLLTIPIPVERRKRYVYYFHCRENPPGINSPMTIDYSGAYFRRDGLGGAFIGGLSPTIEEEPCTSNLNVDYEFFDKNVWPILAKRVPAFNNIKVKNAWSGFYEYNVFDENGIIGPHPYYHNLYIATGFSGHGIQQAPAVGRAIAELILDGNFQTIDLTRFGFDRILLDKPIYETNIV